MGKVKPFSNKADRDSKIEGWALFNADGIIQIQRIDDPPAVSAEINHSVGSIKSDNAAYSYCIRKALKGSKRHLLALYLDGREDAKDIWIPPELRGI